VLQRVETSTDLDKQQRQALINRRDHWWWD
jgi:hypothetical protein